MVLGFLTLLLGVLVAMVLAKRFTLVPIAGLADDVEAVIKGDAPRIPQAQGFSELSELAKSINRLIERSPALSARVAPAHRVSAAVPPAAAPIPQRPVPSPPALHATPAPAAPAAPAPSPTPASPPVARPAAGSSDGARFWVDSEFIVARVEPEAATLLGSTPEAMEGRHVIEAVKDQKTLGVILDSLNTLDSGASSSTAGAPELSADAISVTAAREGDWVVVSLKRAG